MKFKIKRTGSPNVKYMTCGLEHIEAGAAELITRMEGATVYTSEEEKFPHFCDYPAFIKAGKISGHICIDPSEKVERYVTIALAPAASDDGPLISVRIDKRRFKELRQMLDYAEKE